MSPWSRRGRELSALGTSPANVDLTGFEPVTSALRRRRATSCATSPSRYDSGAGTTIGCRRSSRSTTTTLDRTESLSQSRPVTSAGPCSK